MTSASVSIPPAARSTRRTGTLSARLLLIVGSLVCMLLAALVIAQAVRAYSVTLDRFRSIAEDSTAKVDAAEAALQNVADMDANAAVFVATASDNPIHWSSQQSIHDSFQAFREQMFVVREHLDNPAELTNPTTTDPETIAYKNIESFSFDQFWQHLGNLLTAQQNADTATALDQYVVSDNYLQNQIAVYLLQLEALNYTKMQDTKNGAASAINGQVLLLGLLAIVLAALLTALSFWLRRQVRRVLTPGVDLAMVLSWALAILMLLELSQTPNLLRDMVDNAYYSVSAAARTLAVAKLANSAQSGAVIDPTHADFWQQTFDTNKTSVALRLCGHADCLSTTFLAGSDTIAPAILTQAKNMSASDQAAINNIAPLVANAHYAKEAATLEQARLAFNNYVALNAKVGALLKTNLDDAARLATGIDPTQSGGTFKQFTDAITKEGQINRAVFDNTWHTEQNALPLHQWLFGVGGYVLLIVGLAVGLYHRAREL